MNNNKQSSVDWFANESWQLKVQLDNQEISVDEYAVFYVRLLYKAKEMEKEQIINAFCNGDNTDCTSEQNIEEFADQYYNEIYGGGEQ
jgi:hypothetical protein